MGETADQPKPRRQRKRRIWRKLGIALAVLLVIGTAARLAAPHFLRWYVNRTLSQSPLYRGEIGDVNIHLYRGAYSIENIKITKTTGNTPAPFFDAKRVDLAIEWSALFHRKVVGRIVMFHPRINFTSGNDESEDQTGAGGPWLKMIDDLFPFDINSCRIVDGSVHFMADKKDPPVDVYMNNVQASIDNLTNIHHEMKKNVATVDATGMVLNHAKFEYHMKLDPFSYRPTFSMAMRLIGLDVTKTNDLAMAYGKFDFESGWFDLVVQIDAKEGYFDGYVKPLFRNLKVISLQDVKEDNALQLFWEAIIGGVTRLFTNPPHDQFGTVIPMNGDLTSPSTDILATLGNILHNAFVRAYLPKLQNELPDSGITFGKAQEIDPGMAAIEK